VSPFRQKATPPAAPALVPPRANQKALAVAMVAPSKIEDETLGRRDGRTA